MKTTTYSLCFILALVLFAGAETAMWGGSPSRNQVSAEKNLPVSWDTETGANIKWTAELGSQTYGGPLIVGDKIIVGTNNQAERNPEHRGDRGVMMAFNRADGTFLWQIAHPKLPAGRVNDWPQQGVCSTPYAEGDRLYYISNRAEVVALDTEGFLDGENDGPITDEKKHRADRRRLDLDIRHDRRTRCLPPQPRYEFAAGSRWTALRLDQQWRR